jgi:uncharacterized protein YcgL (UPF0745 family)
MFRPTASVNSMFCKIFKSSLRADTYLYIPIEAEFSELPEGLLTHFGQPIFVMDLEVTRDKKLARNNADQILRDLSDQGYHLQMPADDYFMS